MTEQDSCYYYQMLGQLDFSELLLDFVQTRQP